MSETFDFSRNLDLGSYSARRISRDYTLALAAGVQAPLTIDGSTIYVKDASATVTIVFYPSGRSIDLKKGQGENIGPYDSVRISSVGAQSVTLALGHGTFTDNTMISSNEVAVSFQVPDAVLAPGDKAVVALAAAVVISVARSTKKETIISNPSASASRVRLGPVGVDDTKGRNLQPGETATLDGSMAWYAYNPHATVSVTLEILEMDKAS